MGQQSGQLRRVFSDLKPCTSLTTLDIGKKVKITVTSSQWLLLPHGILNLRCKCSLQGLKDVPEVFLKTLRSFDVLESLFTCLDELLIFAPCLHALSVKTHKQNP